jgi:hypothetical protein
MPAGPNEDTFNCLLHSDLESDDFHLHFPVIVFKDANVQDLSDTLKNRPELRIPRDVRLEILQVRFPETSQTLLLTISHRLKVQF